MSTSRRRALQIVDFRIIACISPALLRFTSRSPKLHANRSLLRILAGTRLGRKAIFKEFNQRQRGRNTRISNPTSEQHELCFEVRCKAYIECLFAEMKTYFSLSLASCRSLFISGLFILAGSSVCSLQTS